jgi:hypothetical protein
MIGNEFCFSSSFPSFFYQIHFFSLIHAHNKMVSFLAVVSDNKFVHFNDHDDNEIDEDDDE